MTGRTDAAHAGHGTEARSRIRAADVHLRNYDMQTGHRVWLNVVDDGRQVLERTVRLRPGEAQSLMDAVPAGAYAVEVGVDELRRTVGHCRIGDHHTKTALVEMGNGVVSVTQGIY